MIQCGRQCPPKYTSGWGEILEVEGARALTRQRPGQFLDFDGAQLSAPQVDVFIGVELQKQDGVDAESRRTPH